VQTDWLIGGAETEREERAHIERVRVRQRQGFAMLEALKHELSRQRDNDAPFTAAWDAAYTQAITQVRDKERTEWKRALTETRAAWHSAYHHAPDEKVKRVAALEEALA
jgi:hypothetical protein